MNRLLLLVLIGAATFLVVLYVQRPEVIHDFWLWVVGFSGVILRAFIWIKEKFEDKGKELSDRIASKKDALLKKNPH